MAGAAVAATTNGTVSGGIPAPMKKGMIKRTVSVGLRGQLNKVVKNG